MMVSDAPRPYFVFLAKLASGIAIFFAFFSLSLTSIDPDFWWHIRVGRDIFASGSAPQIDVYTHTMSGYQWVDHEWLFDAGLWALYDAFGFALLAFLFASFAFFPFLIWIVRARSLPSLCILLALALGVIRFAGVRPQILSFVFFFTLFEILRTRFEGTRHAHERARKYAYFGVPILFMLWANVHGGFAAGIALWLSFFVAGVMGRFTQGIPFFPRFSDIFVFFLSVIATLATPYGIGLHKEIVRVLVSSDTARLIAEWQSPLFSGNTVFFLLIATYLFFLFRYLRAYPLRVAAPSVLFFALFLKTARMALFFFITAVPFFEYGKRFLRNEFEKAHGGALRASERTYVRNVTAACIIGSIVWLSYAGLPREPSFFSNLFAVRKAAEYPEDALRIAGDEIAERGGTLFNSYEWGGYILWHAPDIPVFIDGRMPHWRDARGFSAFEEYMSMLSGPDEAREEILTKRNIGVALVSPSEIPLISFLRRRGWMEKFSDNDVIVFVRQ